MKRVNGNKLARKADGLFEMAVSAGKCFAGTD